ncbi:hypothetical protein [Streptomyces sp. NRRL WC-3744]|uniref:hypothetical protein n=1 Tax=Streptomyces sp. NRRL WC-3744 TaxID=1463935 RepID=UPI0004CB9517|nr:hypothetical protein [Streptomyces sp. NRRL WC-3744]
MEDGSTDQQRESDRRGDGDPGGVPVLGPVRKPGIEQPQWVLPHRDPVALPGLPEAVLHLGDLEGAPLAAQFADRAHHAGAVLAVQAGDVHDDRVHRLAHGPYVPLVHRGPGEQRQRETGHRHQRGRPGPMPHPADQARRDRDDGRYDHDPDQRHPLRHAGSAQ